MNTPEKEVYGVANTTGDKHVNFKMRLANTGTTTAPENTADMDNIVNPLESKIYDTSSNKQIWFRTKFGNQLMQFKSDWQALNGQELQKTIKRILIHIWYYKIHLAGHLLESIQWLGSGDNVTNSHS